MCNLLYILIRLVYLYILIIIKKTKNNVKFNIKDNTKNVLNKYNN